MSPDARRQAEDVPQEVGPYRLVHPAEPGQLLLSQAWPPGQLLVLRRAPSGIDTTVTIIAPHPASRGPEARAHQRPRTAALAHPEPPVRVGGRHRTDDSVVILGAWKRIFTRC
ncbi:hypothetical protein A6P39_023880 [Streptomyces sp. FXJ1.172]|uniref:hypothetical protein n=1 Tax=Streptomyces sp. FXJ1.172 TaxID=710705 RepID=UPI000AC44D0E|nr:hypothetical protein [Streptomyces sp. FXJ1.172]WEO96820.1 hypothetical protein A6P39_023880 [Streptomyces sp. FXJ1.172]